MKILPRTFFDQKAETVAQELLGKILVRRYQTQNEPNLESESPEHPNNLNDLESETTIISGIITEVEAYLGEHDPAAHAAAGRTKRTEVLYGKSGHAYVYNLHRYFCLNVVAEPENSPGCVLIRAVQPLAGIETMKLLRETHPSIKKPKNIPIELLTNGPGKLCQAFDITTSLYGTDLTNPNSPLTIQESTEPLPEFVIERTKRIGIMKARDWDLRFVAVY